MHAMALQEFFEGGKDAYLLETLGWVLLCVGGLVVLLYLLSVEAPYGRYSNNEGVFATLCTGFKIPARVGWFAMELPSFLIPLYLVFNVGGRYVGQLNPNIVLLGMYILHYFNRYTPLS